MIMLKRISLTFAFVFCAVAAFSQVTIRASVDKPIADVSEDINLTITVNAPVTDIDAPQMPSLPNFNIYSSGQSRNITMINGKVNTLQKFNYILSPRFAGKSTIGAFTIKVGGQQYATDPIDVEVYRKDSAASKTGGAKDAKPSVPAHSDTAAKTASKMPDFFMTASADKTKAYLNEQILLKIRFYQAQSTLGNPQYDRPKMEGFVPEEIKTNQDSETIEGKQYIYTEFVTALFGILPGKATVGPATVQYSVVEGADMDTFDLFFNAAAGASLKSVKSEPLNIQIEALPKENRPKTFYGAVGTDYFITAEADNTKPQAGEPVTITVTVRGNGNMRAIADIPAPDMGANFRVYDTTSSSSTKLNGTLVGGIKTCKTVIVPRVSGAFEIPKTYFTYFDTATASYKTVSAPPIFLDVTPSSASAKGTSVSFSNDALPASARVEKLNSDISYIKNGKTGIFTLFANFFDALGGFNYLIFVLILAGIVKHIFGVKELPLLAKKKAFKNAKKALAQAKTLGEVSAVLTDYLEAKKGGPIGIMTISDVADSLKLNALNSQALAKLWGEFEMLKYAPAAMLTNSIAVSEAAERTLELIKELEKEIK